MKDLSTRLKIIYPEIDLINDVTIMQESGDPFIAEWKYSKPIPSREELLEADPTKLLNLHKVHKNRLNAYPQIGDQLDAILKQLNYLQMSGHIDLIKDMDTIITKWLKVKKDFPKD